MSVPHVAGSDLTSHVDGAVISHADHHNLLADAVNAVAASTETASYTLVLADAGTVVEMNVAGANNLTIPTNASVAFPIGTVIEIWQMGAGQTSIVAAGGVTIRSPGGKLKLASQYASATLRKRATNEWALEGDISL